MRLAAKPGTPRCPRVLRFCLDQPFSASFSASPRLRVKSTLALLGSAGLRNGRARLSPRLRVFASSIRLPIWWLRRVRRDPMSFDHAWALLALLLPLGWAGWEWRETARRTALGLKAVAFVCIVLALSGPRVVVYQTKVAVAVLADTSASVSSQDLARESAVASQVERGAGRHWTRIIPFARGTRMVSPDERAKDGYQLRHTAGAAGRGTDLELAIRDGVAALPAGMVPRLLLISDGNENL